MDKTDNIEQLYKALVDKKKFVKECAAEFGVRPITVRSNWFSGFYSVPERHLDQVLAMLQKAVAAQNGLASEHNTQGHGTSTL